MTPNSPEGRQRRVTAWSRGGWGAARSKVEELGLGSALGPWAVVPGPLGAYPAPGPLAAHPAPGEELTDFRVGRPGFESWHYAPLTCDMAGSCTSLSLGLFTGSVEVCVYICRKKWWALWIFCHRCISFWGYHNKVPLTGLHGWRPETKIKVSAGPCTLCHL